jgi:hypothetical protein
VNHGIVRSCAFVTNEGILLCRGPEYILYGLHQNTHRLYMTKKKITQTCMS